MRRACPVDCIYIEKIKNPVGKGFRVNGFKIDYTKCMFCALCVDPCPVDCIFMGSTYDQSCFSRDGCIVDFAKLPVEVAWGQATLAPDPHCRLQAPDRAGLDQAARPGPPPPEEVIADSSSVAPRPTRIEWRTPMAAAQTGAKKYFTVAQANAMLPLVQAIVRDITELAQSLRDRHQRLNRFNPAGLDDARREELEHIQRRDGARTGTDARVTRKNCTSSGSS